MRTRHRIPTVFSLYMVDVFCCALGCVILLWLLNLRAAEDQTQQTTDLLRQAEDRGRQASDRLREAEKIARSQGSDLDDAYAYIGELHKRLDELESAESALRKQLAGQTALSADQAKKLADLTGRLDTSDKRAANLMADLKDKDDRLKATTTTAALVPALQKDLKATQDDVAKQSALVAALEKEIAQRMQLLAGVKKELAEVQTAKQTATRTLESRDKELAELRTYKERYLTLEDKATGLEKQLTAARQNVNTLNEDRKAMQAEIGRVRAAADNRFAGIQLTGRRVLFLVDMSGSMELVDENTASPQKWIGVRETVAKVMKSLPDLEKYQILVFSEKASFLFGGDGAWIEYDPATSSDKALKALAAVKPKGGTNMYTAMELAFTLRAKGLDTIYFLSDGLPNMGDGLTPEQERKLSEQQQSELLGKYIRNKLKTTWNREIKDQPKVRINTIGFFYESPDVGAFLWALAREHDGSFVGMSKP
jgi:predicted  nucleic acid-binding Zn-ribbon protein